MHTRRPLPDPGRAGRSGSGLPGAGRIPKLGVTDQTGSIPRGAVAHRSIVGSDVLPSNVNRICGYDGGVKVEVVHRPTSGPTTGPTSRSTSARPRPSGPVSPAGRLPVFLPGKWQAPCGSRRLSLAATYRMSPSGRDGSAGSGPKPASVVPVPARPASGPTAHQPFTFLEPRNLSSSDRDHRRPGGRRATLSSRPTASTL